MNSIPPFLRDWDGFSDAIIVRHHHHLSDGEQLLRLRVNDGLLHRHGLVADLQRPHSHFDGRPPLDGLLVRDVDIREDDADIHERLSFLEQAEMFDVVDARLLEEGHILGVVEVTLRVEVTVADFDGMVEVEFGHAAIIHNGTRTSAESAETF